MTTRPISPHPEIPAGSNTVNSFIMSDSAPKLIAFLLEVFGATEVAEARTSDADGLILHSELLIGDSMISIAERKPGWPYTPAFTRVYVDDLDATLDRARANGARIVTEPTDFWGDTLARFADPYGHLWWVYKHDPAAAWDDQSEESPAENAEGNEPIPDESWESYATPGLEYIHSTLIEAMDALRDPRSK